MAPATPGFTFAEANAPTERVVLEGRAPWGGTPQAGSAYRALTFGTKSSKIPFIARSPASGYKCIRQAGPRKTISVRQNSA
jgi:hypothetical protein